MTAYKLLRVRSDGSLGSLFINRTAKLPVGKWMKAERHVTKGFSPRPYWHCLKSPKAAHLSEKGRAWYKVEVKDWHTLLRTESQGGVWVLADKMKILGRVKTTNDT